MEIPYPWEEGAPMEVAVVTDTGDVVRLDLGLASLTPVPDRQTWATYAWIGLFIGLIPVAAGLCAFAFLAGARPGVLDFTLALTVGLLAFLLLDTVLEGWELAAAADEPFQGQEVFVLAAVLTVVALVMIGSGSRRAASVSAALPVAAAIGVHNLGEGIAVGAALATGRTELGLALIVGFGLHNVTEGIAIAAPLTQEPRARHTWTRLAGLAAVAGLPAIPGVWLGGFAFDPTIAAIAFGVAAGAIAQVLWVVGRPIVSGAAERVVAGGVGIGFAAMYLTGLLTI